MQERLLNITIPVFNRPDLTENTIRKARANTKVPHWITVVDNGSESKTQDLLKSLRDEGAIDYLFRLEQNFGVAVAANVGWRLVPAPLYMKLDNDIEIHTDSWFEIVFAQMCKVSSAAVWGGDFHNQLDNPSHVKERKGLFGRAHTHISGAAILIPREISDLVGYWCEDYGLYGCEDGDYGVRLRSFGIPQYYYDHRPFMTHLGHDSEKMRVQYGMHKSILQNSFRKLYNTNMFLYMKKHRVPNMPAQLIPSGFDGEVVTMKTNGEYKAMWKAFISLHEIVESYEGVVDIKLESVAAALNNFVTVQNATWQQAIDASEKAYSVIRKQVHG